MHLSPTSKLGYLSFKMYIPLPYLFDVIMSTKYTSYDINFLLYWDDSVDSRYSLWVIQNCNF